MTRRTVKRNDDDALTREPEMAQAYRGTWVIGIESKETLVCSRVIMRSTLRESVRFAGTDARQRRVTTWFKADDKQNEDTLVREENTMEIEKQRWAPLPAACANADAGPFGPKPGVGAYGWFQASPLSVWQKVFENEYGSRLLFDIEYKPAAGPSPE